MTCCFEGCSEDVIGEINIKGKKYCIQHIMNEISSIINENKCCGTKKDGSRCTRNVKSGKYCFQHSPDSVPKSESKANPKCCACGIDGKNYIHTDGKYYCYADYPKKCDTCNHTYCYKTSFLGGCPECNKKYNSPPQKSVPRTDYDILGISPKASKEEIKKGYYRMARMWHPDKCEKPEAKDRFQEVQAAYERLYGV